MAAATTPLRARLAAWAGPGAAQASSVRTYRAGFLFVVALLAGVAAALLLLEVGAGAHTEALVGQALARAELIGRVRLDVVGLEAATEAHIRASDGAELAAADAAMQGVLADIGAANAAYTRALPDGAARGAFERFHAACRALAAQVRTALDFSRAREAERARQHLAERIRPLSAEVDRLATALAADNAEQARALLEGLQRQRARRAAAGGAVALLAVLVSLAVFWRATSLLGRQEAVIRGQLEELGRRNRELDAFASRVAHDLMGPLAPVRGYLTLVRRSGALADASAREMVQQAEEGVGRATALVEALLRFCRAGGSALPGVRGPGGAAARGDLDTAVSTALLEVAQSASARGVAVERALAPGVTVACPLQLLQSVAHNLLSNAVKYSAGCAGPRVRVSARAAGGEGVLEVEDNGIGMDAEVRAALFTPFFRAPAVRALPGHGLGLATARRIVEAHGGALEVESRPGAGTRVRVRLPLAGGAGA